MDGPSSKCPVAGWACQTGGRRRGRRRAPGRSAVLVIIPADDRPRAPDRRRCPRVSVRRVRRRSRRAWTGARPPPPLLRRAASGAARPRAPGGVLPLVGVPGLPDLPGLGATRGGDGPRRTARVRAAGPRGPPVSQALPPRELEPHHAPSTDTPPPLPPRRNPPRAWAAPPPWAGDADGEQAEPPSFLAARPPEPSDQRAAEAAALGRRVTRAGRQRRRPAGGRLRRRGG